MLSIVTGDCDAAAAPLCWCMRYFAVLPFCAVHVMLAGSPDKLKLRPPRLSCCAVLQSIHLARLAKNLPAGGQAAGHSSSRSTRKGKSHFWLDRAECGCTVSALLGSWCSLWENNTLWHYGPPSCVMLTVQVP